MIRTSRKSKSEIPSLYEMTFSVRPLRLIDVCLFLSFCPLRIFVSGDQTYLLFERDLDFFRLADFLGPFEHAEAPRLLRLRPLSERARPSDTETEREREVFIAKDMTIRSVLLPRLS